jgi:hypothetical protein
LNERRLRFRTALALSTAATVFATSAAHAEEGRFSDRFFRGTTPGALPPAKLAIVGAFYTASIASVGIGVASLIHAGQQSNDAENFKYSQPRGFCRDLASAACVSYRSLLDEERGARTTGLVLLGTGGLLALGGALTAELWKNDAPRVALDVRRDGLTLGLSGEF